ncbi:MAG: hypothetical protein NDJ90_01345 [Oligoflexia bacterium]|nr:hypothetical protein [Oligoflexia bacterium]
MANPNLSEKTESTASSIRDASERFAREAKSDAKDMINDASEAASEFYDRASLWVQDNYGKSIAIVATLAAVGMFGYVLGRNQRSKDFPQL